MAFSSPGVSAEGHMERPVVDDSHNYGEMSNRSEELCEQKESPAKTGEEPLQQPQIEGSRMKGSEPKQKASTVGKGDLDQAKPVSYFSLFKYADWKDVFLMTFGVLGAIGDGLEQPASMYVAAALLDAFGSNRTLAAVDPKQFKNTIDKYVIRYLYLGIACSFAGFLEAACLMRTGERQTGVIRSKYLRAILRQDEGFFDSAGTNAAEVVNGVSADTLVIQAAISEKAGHFIVNVMTFIGGIAVSFYLVWRVAIILVAFSPFLIIPGIIYGRTVTDLSRKMQSTYSTAGTIAEQAISSIRTVYSFVGEEKTQKRFSESLDSSVKIGMEMGFAKGVAVGSMGITFAIWGFLSWYGSTLILRYGVSGAKLLFAGVASLAGGLALGSALPNLRYFSEGRSAATRLFAIIDRVPKIDADDMNGQVLKKVNGSIELRDVDFAYPSRPDTQIFKSFNLHIPAGITVALVGGSGSGKSTVLALIERFYDPSNGQVLLDGIDIKDLQLKWMRSQIGLVSQEPLLFATTIEKNIVFGKEGASMEEVIKAAKSANAHNFISGLPMGYDTQVGEKGVQMSGGQKQRIAVARAILKNPPILLLDEATSALDAESEEVVQGALKAAVLGRTTVVVAHRLATIRTADLIAVVSGGQIVELGPHDKLLDIEGGVYAGLIHLQQSRREQDTTTEEVKISIQKMRQGRLSSSKLSQESISSPRNSQSSLTGASMNHRSPRKSPNLGGAEVHDAKDDVVSAPEPKMKAPSFRRLLAINKAEWKQAVLGSIGAATCGVIQPLYYIFLGRMLSAFYLTDHIKFRRKIDAYSLIFVALAFISFIANLVQHYNFGAMGELLIKRVRTNMLAKILTFEVGWFDQDENSSGAICSRLASEANVVRSLVGDRISMIVQAVSALIVAYIFALVISWKFSLVLIAVQPIVMICFYVKKTLLRNMYSLTLKAQEEASQVAGEVVSHHRTISAFSCHERIMVLFEQKLTGAHKEAQRRPIIAGIGLGSSQFFLYCCWTIDFWWGGELVSTGKLYFGDMVTCALVTFAAFKVIADVGSMTQDVAKGATSIITIFSFLDRKTQINPDDLGSRMLDKVHGHVELRDVDFVYPTRPDVLVLKGFNLEVTVGRNVALVGQSGSGKSTIIGLIERFYDPSKGMVMIDGVDIRALHLRTLRSYVALVGQEPVLFAGTIRDNILYGRQNATEAEIVEASKAANAFNFISSQKDGFDTQTGERGVQLSGGQKQRIAIARAILKNPAILLLDEATSALDAQSERIVQDALDRVMIGRTTIVVAHRLSTIQNCDSIAVMQDGSIFEQGRHEELIARGETGAYYALVKLQTKNIES